MLWQLMSPAMEFFAKSEGHRQPRFSVSGGTESSIDGVRSVKSAIGVTTTSVSAWQKSSLACGPSSPSQAG